MHDYIFFYDVELYNFAREKQNWVKGKGGGGGGGGGGGALKCCFSIQFL